MRNRQAQTVTPAFSQRLENRLRQDPVQYHHTPSSPARSQALQLQFSVSKDTSDFHGPYYQDGERRSSADSFATHSPCFYCSNDLPGHDTLGNEKWPCSQCGSGQNFVSPATSLLSEIKPYVTLEPQNMARPVSGDDNPWLESQVELLRSHLHSQDVPSVPIILSAAYRTSFIDQINHSLLPPNTEDPRFVIYQNTHPDPQLQSAVCQRLIPEAQNDDFSSHRSKYRDRVSYKKTRMKNRRLETQKRQKRNLGLSSDRKKENDSAGSIGPDEHPSPGTDSSITTPIRPNNAITNLREVGSLYKTAIESLSEEEASELITAWMDDLSGIAVPCILIPSCWPEKEDFDLPEYLKREVKNRVLFHFVCGEPSQSYEPEMIEKLCKTMSALKFRPIPKDGDGNQCRESRSEIPMAQIDPKRRGDLEKIMDFHKDILKVQVEKRKQKLQPLTSVSSGN